MPEWIAQKQEWEWAESELDAEVEAGARRTAERRRQSPLPTITDARFLPGERRMRVDFDNGTTFIFPVDQVQGLSGGGEDQLAQFKVLSYDTLGWDNLETIVPISEVMAGILGSKAWMKRLSEMGKRGGSIRSESKVQAARENGKRGGRPKKAAL